MDTEIEKAISSLDSTIVRSTDLLITAILLHAFTNSNAPSRQDFDQLLSYLDEFKTRINNSTAHK